LPLLKAAYDRGLNTWDTANVYSNGESEIIIGKAIKKFNIPRHKLVILSKCQGTVGEEHGVRAFFYSKEIQKSKDYVNHGGYLISLSNSLIQTEILQDFPATQSSSP
jgi:aryl-alcohol dehydrogenase-like predicted oxidoreductase